MRDDADTINAKPMEAASKHLPYLLSGGRLVRAVISQRAGGLLIVINMNPDQECNFDCLYCEVRRSPQFKRRRMNVRVMSKELQELLFKLQPGRAHALKELAKLPTEFHRLNAVALSGDGEPTLCPKFYEVVKEVIRIRESRRFPWFKLILVTNATALHLARVWRGMKLFSEDDEIWVKLDAGTPTYMRFVNNTRISLQSVLLNIKKLGQQRPVMIQSMFCSIDGHGPTDAEIKQYGQRLNELKQEGTRIAMVQIYSVIRPSARPGCVHLPLARLSEIARLVQESTGLETEVY